MSLPARPGFNKIILGWNSNPDINDIPRRLKKIEEWKKTVGELNEAEETILTFMKDVQQTREFVRRKPAELEEDDE